MDTMRSSAPAGLFQEMRLFIAFVAAIFVMRIIARMVGAMRSREPVQALVVELSFIGGVVLLLAGMMTASDAMRWAGFAFLAMSVAYRAILSRR